MFDKYNCFFIGVNYDEKLIVWSLVISMCALLLTACGNGQEASRGNYTDEMKIPYSCDLSAEDGADSVERQGDHQGSPYFNTLDFYHLESSDTLTILSHFKTQQQTSEWSCGVSSALMVLNWYGKLGDYNEESLAAYRSNGLEPGATSLSQLIEIFQGVGGFDLYSTYDCQDQVHEVFTFDYIQKTLAAGNPIMVGWNDWGGHWQVIIGYDTMGTGNHPGRCGHCRRSPTIPPTITRTAMACTVQNGSCTTYLL